MEAGAGGSQIQVLPVKLRKTLFQNKKRTGDAIWVVESPSVLSTVLLTRKKFES